MNECEAPLCRLEGTHKLRETYPPHNVFKVCDRHGEVYTNFEEFGDNYELLDKIELLTVDDFFKEL